MKNWIVILFFGFYAFSAIGQNVGIGTNTPQEKLDVNGSIRGNSINLAGASGEYRIRAEGAPVEMLDQQQQSVGSYVTDSSWQSFTAGVSGILKRIELCFYESSTVHMKIYEGEGPNNNPLSSVVYAASFGWHSSPPLNVPVIAGQKYTISLTNGMFWYLGYNNPYTAGRSSLDSTIDMTFKTYVSVPSLFKVDNLGNVFVPGKLGLGTSNPTARLHLNGSPGNLRIEGGTEPFPYFSFGGLGEFAVDASGIPKGRFVIKNDGNIGINNPSPSEKLDVIGNAKISGGLALTGASADLDVDGPISTKYSGSLVLTNITTTGLQTLNLLIPQVPNGWNFTNTVVMVSNSDGVCQLTIHQAKLSSVTNIELWVTVHTPNLARFNYIIFKI